MTLSMIGFESIGVNMTERLARAESDCAEQGGGHCAAGPHLLDQGPLGEEDSARQNEAS
jgi:hypothetical protein